MGRYLPLHHDVATQRVSVVQSRVRCIICFIGGGLTNWRNHQRVGGTVCFLFGLFKSFKLYVSFRAILIFTNN